MFRPLFAALALVGIAAMSGPAAAQQRYFSPDTVYNVPVGDAPGRGPAAAPVTVVEFSDFRCGYCRRAHATLEELMRLYPGQVRIVYKHFTVIDPEGESMLAALAAEAARGQGQFWAMHDRLFTHRGALTPAAVESFARDVGLDMVQFRQAMAASALRDTVVKEAGLATRLGLTGTPMFFVNGRPVEGAQPLDVFIRVIDDELKRAARVVDSGVAPAAVYGALIADGEREGARTRPQPERLDPAGTYPVPLGDPRLRRGSDHALVTLVVFDDFECPFCAKLVPTIERLRVEYGKDLRIQFRHSPLPFHKHAQLAHEAAMAAAAQGKFWAMHDRLFANRDQLERADLERYARQIGLDQTKFRAALDDNRFAGAVQADIEAARALGVRGTPTAFVNGAPIVGAQPIEVFRAMIDAKKAQAATLIEDGTPRAGLYAAVVGLPPEPVVIEQVDRHIEALVACRAGDADSARRFYDAIDDRPRRRMIRADCRRYGVELPK